MKTKKKKPVKAKAKKKDKVVVATKPKQGRQTKEHEENWHAAVDGNQWYQRRAKHGRDKIFSTPEILKQEAWRYIAWNEVNPEKRAELVKYEGYASEHSVSVKRLLSLTGLCIFLGVSSSYFRAFKSAIRAKESAGTVTETDMDFLTVIQMIEDVIQTQQVSGAAEGFFNGNIISRLVGLVDKKDITSGDAPLTAPKIEVYNVGPELAGSEQEVKDRDNIKS